MGRSDRGDRGNRGGRRGAQQGKPGETKALDHRPFQGALKGFKARPAGPDCLRCRQPVDTRFGWSLVDRRGSRRLQRNGWLHSECEEAAALERAKAQGKVSYDQEGNPRPGFGVNVEVPLLSEEDIRGIVGGDGGVS